MTGRGDPGTLEPCHLLSFSSPNGTGGRSLDCWSSMSVVLATAAATQLVAVAVVETFVDADQVSRHRLLIASAIGPGSSAVPRMSMTSPPVASHTAGRQRGEMSA